MNWNLKKPFFTRHPGLIAIGLSSPDTTLTSSTEAIAQCNEQDWGQLQFIDHTMERAMLSLIGLTEAGAETPWDEATRLLRRHLDPKVLETDAGAFVAATWRATGECRFDIAVQGTMPKSTIDLD